MTNITRFEFADFAIDWVEYNGQWYAPFEQVWKYFEYHQSQAAKRLLEDDDLYSPAEAIQLLSTHPTWITRKGFLVLSMRSDKAQAKFMRRAVVDFFDTLLTKGYVDLTGEMEKRGNDIIELNRKVSTLEKRVRRLQSNLQEDAQFVGATKLVKRLTGKYDVALTAKVFRALGWESQQVNHRHHDMTPFKLEQLINKLVQEGAIPATDALSLYTTYAANLKALEQADE